MGLGCLVATISNILPFRKRHLFGSINEIHLCQYKIWYPPTNRYGIHPDRVITFLSKLGKYYLISSCAYNKLEILLVLHPFQIIDHFGFCKDVHFAVHLDITYNLKGGVNVKDGPENNP